MFGKGIMMSLLVLALCFRKCSAFALPWVNSTTNTIASHNPSLGSLASTNLSTIATFNTTLTSWRTNCPSLNASTGAFHSSKTNQTTLSARRSILQSLGTLPFTVIPSSTSSTPSSTSFFIPTTSITFSILSSSPYFNSSTISSFFTNTSTVQSPSGTFLLPTLPAPLTLSSTPSPFSLSPSTSPNSAQSFITSTATRQTTPLTLASIISSNIVPKSSSTPRSTLPSAQSSAAGISSTVASNSGVSSHLRSSSSYTPIKSLTSTRPARTSASIPSTTTASTNFANAPTLSSPTITAITATSATGVLLVLIAMFYLRKHILRNHARHSRGTLLVNSPPYTPNPAPFENLTSQAAPPLMNVLSSISEGSIMTSNQVIDPTIATEAQVISGQSTHMSDYIAVRQSPASINHADAQRPATDNESLYAISNSRTASGSAIEEPQGASSAEEEQQQWAWLMLDTRDDQGLGGHNGQDRSINGQDRPIVWSQFVQEGFP